MKKVYEAFVYWGIGLYFDEDCIPMYTGRNDIVSKRKTYLGDTWADVFMEALRDYCNNKSVHPKVKDAMIGFIDQDSNPNYYYSSITNTTYIPVYFKNQGPGCVVFGIEETNVQEMVDYLRLYLEPIKDKQKE